jgi:cytochrome P450
MTTGEIVTNCATLVLAGFDTTATTLTYTCHYLAARPAMQERLRAEILEHCPVGDEVFLIV